jgi:hypothetical protein
MTSRSDRRKFLRDITAASACLAVPPRLFAAPQTKSLLVFTKSSGFEHAVVKRQGEKLSIAETVITELGKKHGFEVTCSKDGRILDCKNVHNHKAVFFFITGDLATSGPDESSRGVIALEP